MDETNTNADASKSLKDEDDFLGYGVYADTLWARIAQAINKDLKSGKTVGDDPLVVGLFGEWGAGKSKLLSLIQRRAEIARDASIKGHKFDGNEGLLIPVFFQPWKYEHEKHLLVPMLLHILAALEETLAQARDGSDELPGAALKALETAKNAMGKLVSGVKAVVGVVEPISAIGFQLAEAGAAYLAKPKASTRMAKQFEYQGNGRAYYEMHRILKDVTRPAKKKEIVGEQHHHKEFPVSFVVFIDDLDRCLPENAVGTLELIKTAFNLESFAFVLALDEEVVERGIGHRYKDYSFQGKKPEMPITGFEYLEKIVHLPLKLPALTRTQALDFLKRYEERLLQQRYTGDDAQALRQARQWFVQREQKKVLGSKLFDREVFGTQTDASNLVEDLGADFQFNLAHLVVNSFTVYVPRKLVRIVELFHQTLDVLETTGDVSDLNDGSVSSTAAKKRIERLGLGSEIDVRIFIAFLLLQLFQPELYRCLRRTRVGFDVLRDAFANRKLQANISDVDLWLWAAHGHLDEAAYADKEKQPPVSLKSAVFAIREHDKNARYTAQQLYFPIVERLLDHRASQRHAFDPLRLFASLVRSSELDLPKEDSHKYFGILSQSLPQAGDLQDYLDFSSVVTAPPVDTPQKATTLEARAERHIAPAELMRRMLSTAPREQDSLPEALGLIDHRLSDASSDDLLNDLVSLRVGNSSLEFTRRLFRGLQVVAPYILRADGERFWGLVKDAEHGGNLGDAFTSIGQVKTRETWADIRSTLGQDDRFESAKPWICTQRFNRHTAKQEPIPGYVCIPKGEFQIGHAVKADTSNPPEKITISDDFYVARHLTTVAQYDRFVQGNGYKTEELWDEQGWRWLQGTLDSKIEDKYWRERLNSRSLELRQQPMDWQAQLPHASRPVHGVNWFEARAYVRWLQTQLKSEQDLPSGYEARLPTEAQWERTARALADGRAHEQPWVWGADGQSLELKANIGDSKIGRVGVVGLFASNPLGITDLAGNVWEWQDNLYDDKRLNIQQRLKKDHPLKIAKEWQESDLTGLRGGSWLSSAGHAQASYRDGTPSISWGGGVGFRVVLSLA
jgi:formylglycine-generating enzyme required for sulfatase activity